MGNRKLSELRRKCIKELRQIANALEDIEALETGGGKGDMSQPLLKKGVDGKTPEWNPPECFGTYWCPDDCEVSCPYVQECKEEEENLDEDREHGLFEED